LVALLNRKAIIEKLSVKYQTFVQMTAPTIWRKASKATQLCVINLSPYFDFLFCLPLSSINKNSVTNQC